MTHLDTTGTAPAPSAFPALFAPGRIGALGLKNRVLMAPMEKNLGTADGIVTQRYIDYLVERALADVGLLRVEATYVDPVGKGRPYQLGAHADAVIPELRRLVAAVHGAGGRISLELAHCGRQTNALVTGRQPVAPSPVPCAASGGYMPRALTIGEIADIVERFAQAAARAQSAGVDAIEIHGASGYLVNAFTSPYTNLRTDEYGGSLENRMRFALEVVAAIRAAVGPELPMLYRMSADDGVAGGITAAESGPLAAALERAGVDLIDVSAGTYESILLTQPPMEALAGTLLTLAGEIKRHVAIPVATAGKLGNLEVAERSLADGTVDFVTIGRGLHADPELLTKARAGRMDEVRRCIACAECVAFLGEDQPAYCAVNPATLRERAFRVRRPTLTQHVLVVGGGPAGLEAARTARLRGHTVQVLERSDRLGGQARFGALAPGRRDFAEPVRYLERELARLGVEVSRDTDVDAELVGAIGPDAVIVATGAGLVSRPIPGRDRANVVTASEYLALEERFAGVDLPDAHPAFATGGPVAVVGGDWVGGHVASLLLGRGLPVTIVEPRRKLAYDMGDQQGAVLRSRVTDHPGVGALHLGCTVERIAEGHLVVWQADADRFHDVPCGAVVLVEQRQPDDGLAADVREHSEPALRVRAIGDCVRPRKLQDAILDGATIGAAL